MAFREGGHRIDRHHSTPSATRVFSVARDKADARRSPAERVSFALDQLKVGKGHPARNRLFGAAKRMLERAMEDGRDAEHLEPVVPAVPEVTNETPPARLRGDVASAQANWEKMVRDGLVPAEILQEIEDGEIAA